MAEPSMPGGREPKAPKMGKPKLGAPKLSPPKPSGPKLNPPTLKAPGRKASKFGGSAGPGGPGGGMSRHQRAGLGGASVLGIGVIGAGFLLPTAQKSGYYQEASKALSLRQQAARNAAKKSMMPAHSALVKQKAAVNKNVASPLLQEINKAKGQGKSLAQAKKTNELAQFRKMTAPLKGQAAKDQAALKNMANLQKKAALKKMMPARSAVVKQKVQLNKGLMSPLAQDVAKAKGLAKGAAAKDLAHANKMAAPLKSAASKEKAALKQVVNVQKKAALKKLMPARSALVKKRALVSGDLAAVRSTIGKDLSGFKKEVGQVKTAAKKSAALQAAKKQEATKKKSLMRLLKIPSS